LSVGYTYNEKDLLVLVAAGDRQAFSQAYKLTYTKLYYLAKRIVGEEAARDIVAETYARLLKQPRTFDNIAHMAGYLSIMTRNACIDLLKRENRDKTLQEDLRYLSDPNWDSAIGDEDEIRAALYKMILDEIEKLSPLVKSIFKLSYLEGKSNAEICDILQIKDKTVRNKKAEALKAIRIGLGRFNFLLGILKIFPGF
jgi:RNA polymerase sigma factor (sigma-70 family)